MAQTLVKLRKQGQRVISERPAGRTQMLRELSETVAEIRQEAKEKGLDEMSKREIKAAVAAARRDLNAI